LTELKSSRVADLSEQKDYLLIYFLCFSDNHSKILFNFALQSTMIMDNSVNSAEELRQIRKMMDESSRFLSLSGLSGVFAGLFAITGALVALYFLKWNSPEMSAGYESTIAGARGYNLRLILAVDAMLVLLLSVSLAFFLSLKKAKKEGKPFFSPASKRMLLNLFIPLVAGGTLVLVMFFRNEYSYIIPALLIFYGVALVSAGKFTVGEIFWLGLLEIITGLTAALLPGYGLYFWIFGFGLLHIVYGIIMYRKYEA